jgi:hypothetical protein
MSSISIRIARSSAPWPRFRQVNHSHVSSFRVGISPIHRAESVNYFGVIHARNRPIGNASVRDEPGLFNPYPGMAHGAATLILRPRCARTGLAHMPLFAEMYEAYFTTLERHATRLESAAANLKDEDRRAIMEHRCWASERPTGTPRAG